jgi:hypothetical protein
MEDLGNFTEAERCFAEALKGDPEYKNALWSRSMMRLRQGDLERGFAEYETRIPYHRGEGSSKYPIFPAVAWDGVQPLADKRVFCCVEQGIGDTIFFSRWLPWLSERCGKLYLCCMHEMMVLLWQFHEQGIVEFVPEGVPIPKCDYSVYLGSLPAFSKIYPDDPGLIRKRADVQMRIGKATIPAPLGPDAYKVGIVWSGNPKQDRNDERKIPLELMLTLAEHPNVWLYSLQAGPPQADLERLCAQDLVCDLGPQLQERGLTVAATAILQMDLVITCCTSMAHLAGALGHEAWVVLTENAYWLWQRERTDSPWYPSLTLYRQRKTDDWKEVISRVRDDLIDRVDERLKASRTSPAQTETTHG